LKKSLNNFKSIEMSVKVEESVDMKDSKNTKQDMSSETLDTKQTDLTNNKSIVYLK